MSLSRGSPNDTRTSGWTDSHALTHFQVTPTRARFVTLNRPLALLRRLGCAQSVSCLAFFFLSLYLEKKNHGTHSILDAADANGTKLDG